MTDISPLDILGRTFKKRLTGYDPDEVQQFLGQIANAMESVLRDRGELKQRVRRFEQQLVEFREREGALQDALVAAQKSAEQTVETARNDGQLIIDEAQALADSLVDDAHERAHNIETTISDLRSRRREVRAELMRLAELLQGLIRDDQQLEREDSTSPRLAVLHRRRDSHEGQA